MVFVFLSDFECLFKNTKVSKDDRMAFNKLVEFYSPEISSQVTITKLKMWKVKLAKESINIKSGLDALAICNKDLYPNMYLLYTIVCTLPMFYFNS